MSSKHWHNPDAYSHVKDIAKGIFIKCDPSDFSSFYAYISTLSLSNICVSTMCMNAWCCDIFVLFVKVKWQLNLDDFFFKCALTF